MNEMITKKIENKIFSKDNIIKIANMIYSIYEDNYKQFIADPLNEASHYRGRFKVELVCDDGTQYTNESLDLLTKNDIIDYKKVISINITFWGHRREEIRFMINEGKGNHFYINKLEVSGDNGLPKLWFRELEEVIEHVKPQKNFILNHKGIVATIFSFVLSFLTFLTITLFIGVLGKIGWITLNSKPQTENVWIYITFLLVMISAVWRLEINKWINELWWDIEFQFGPEHLQRSKAKRKVTWIAFSTVILPVILFFLSIL
ncbi:hypothetical protein AABM38_10170 [Heyndrickxia sp. MSNUG]|uniref:hypothetical protein n=1 Tax=Heyndrickxia sp. MSNUG TaxID=3136677 RepID=UPI003C2C4FBF